MTIGLLTALISIIVVVILVLRFAMIKKQFGLLRKAGILQTILVISLFLYGIFMLYFGLISLVGIVLIVFVAGYLWQVIKFISNPVQAFSRRWLIFNIIASLIIIVFVEWIEAGFHAMGELRRFWIPSLFIAFLSAILLFSKKREGSSQ